VNRGNFRVSRAVVLLACGLSGISYAQAVSEAQVAPNDAQAIRSLTDDWIEFSAKGDIEAYLDIVADDFLWLGAGAGSGYAGKDEVRQFLEPYFNAYSFSMENVRSQEITISSNGRLAVHEWIGTAIVEAKDGSSITSTKRKYFDFWRKDDDGIWRCARHLFVPIK